MIKSAFHRPGDHSRLGSCPPLRFASARRLGFPVLRTSTTTTPFVRLLPRRYDREHDPFERSVPRFSGWPCRAHGQSCGDESLQDPDDFRHREERRTGLPSLRFPTSVLLRAGGRASRAVDDFSRPCERLSSSPRAESPESRDSSCFLGKEESPYSTRLEHLLVTDCVRRSLESTPTRPTSRRHDRRFAPREGHERANASRCFRSSITRSRA